MCGTNYVIGIRDYRLIFPCGVTTDSQVHNVKILRRFNLLEKRRKDKKKRKTNHDETIFEYGVNKKKNVKNNEKYALRAINCHRIEHARQNT